MLAALALLALHLAGARGTIAGGRAGAALQALAELPAQVAEILARAERRASGWPTSSTRKSDFLFLGRGIKFPIALEGALKLKEISYIHAEGYPAGEMKHGPIALIDEEMPVVAIAPQRQGLRQDAQQHRAGQGARRASSSRSPSDGDEEIAAKADHVIYVPPTWAPLAPDPDRRSRCSCSPTTSRSAAAATSTSRATWPSRSPSSSAGGAPPRLRPRAASPRVDLNQFSTSRSVVHARSGPHRLSPMHLTVPDHLPSPCI